jgi:uncharacterized protein (TIGR02246 family)
MMKTRLTLVFSALAMMLAFAGVMTHAPGRVLVAQGSNADEVAITQRLTVYADARQKRDAKAEALCYAEDGDFRSSAGPFVSGRTAIEKQLIVNDPNYKFQLEILSLRFLDPQVAIVETELRTGVTEPLGKLVGTYVMVKRGSDWLIGAARIARAMP